MTVGIGETDGVGDGVGTSSLEVLKTASANSTGSTILAVFMCAFMFDSDVLILEAARS